MMMHSHPSKSKNWRRIVSYYAKYKYSIGLLVLFLFVLNVISMIYILVSKEVIDSLLSSNNTLAIEYIIIYVIVGIISFIIGYYYNITSTKSVELIYNETLIRVYRSIFETYYEIFSNHDKGYWINRMFSDVANVRVLITGIAIPIVNNIIKATLATYILFHMNTSIACVCIAASVITLCTVLAFEKRIKHYNGLLILNGDRISESIVESINSYLTIKLYNFIDYDVNCKSSLVDKNMKTTIKAHKVGSALALLNDFTKAIVMAIILYILSKQIFAHTFTIGEFYVASFVYTIQINSVRNIASIRFRQFASEKSLIRVIDAIELPREDDEGDIVIDRIDSINLANVKYQYSDKHSICVTNLNLKRGNLYLVQGASGTGKTTLMFKMLTRLIRAYSGKIIFNGIDIQRIRLSSLREQIRTVSQDPMIINGTIETNIRMCGDAKINKHFYRQIMPKYSLEHPISEGGKNLSIGEKQRVALLRAIFSEKSSVIILDEITSAQDECNIDTILSILAEIKQNKIIIVISHTDLFLEVADQRIVIDHNGIVKQFHIDYEHLSEDE